MKPIVLCFIFVVICGTVYSAETLISVPVQPNMKLVATADGKSFFADYQVGRSWIAAGTYCRSVGMQLASVTSKNQEDALSAAYHSTDFAGGFWTSGRDAQINRQFTWNGTGEEISSQSHFADQTPPLYQTCVVYLSRSDNLSGLVFWLCSFDQYGTLCEA